MTFSNGLRLALASTLIFGATTASAQGIVQYDFAAGSPAATTIGTATGTDVTFGPFTSSGSSPFIRVDGGGVSVDTSDTNDTADTGTDSLADALDPPDGKGDYITFTIGSTSAGTFGISSISYNYSAIDNGAGFSLSSHLLTGETGFDASSSLETTTFTSNDSDTIVEVLSANDDLQNLTDPLEVRIYFSDDTFNSGPDHILDDIVIVVVPEPSSLALLGLGGVCLLWRRRPTQR